MYLLIDNFDSFTYNLYQYISINTKKEVVVLRNNKLDNFNFNRIDLDGIFISPGPGHPEQIPQVIKIIRDYYKETAILGICLGHQAIGYAFNSIITRATNIMHGKQSLISHNNDYLFSSIDSKFTVGRYHSLVIDKNNISDNLEIIASIPKNKEIMAIKYRDLPIYGVQFHPESILTPEGTKIIKNFITITEKEVQNV